MKKLFSGLLSMATFLGACFFGFNVVGAEEAAANTEGANVIANEKKDTEVVFIVDKSGSMRGLVSDTIGSFNSVLDDQKNDKENGGAYVTTVFFNHGHEKVHDRKDIQAVEHITDKDYKPSGSTALLDAVGDTINELSNNNEIKDHKVMVVIITDGYENSSREYSKKQVKELIEAREKDGWQFVFCGANIDAASEGGHIGICKERTIKFAATGEGVASTYADISDRISNLRAT